MENSKVNFPVTVLQLHIYIVSWLISGGGKLSRDVCEMSKGRVRKKNPEKVWSFAKLGGGGVSDGSKMPILYFGKVFFQLACRIILGPPKHVLHLV